MRTRIFLASIALVCLSGRQRSGNLRVSIGPACAISIVDSSVSRFDRGTGTEFRGLTHFRLIARTSRAGKGEILLRFHPSDSLGPLSFSFVTKVGSVGTPITGSALDPAAFTRVAAIGQNSHTDRAGDTGSIEWNYMTGVAAPPVFSPEPQLMVNCQ